MTAHIWSAKRTFFLGSPPLRSQNFLDVLRRRAAHVHRVLGEVHVAVGRDAQCRRRLDVGRLKDDLALEAVGHLRQGRVGRVKASPERQRGEDEDSEQRAFHGGTSEDGRRAR
jgi:hypothetical protein